MGVRFGDCVLDLDRRELRRRDELVHIEPRALRVLEELVRHRDRVVSRDELLDAVWGDRFVGDSAVSTQIKEIRRAVGDSGRTQAVVRTVHGEGYAFVAPVTVEVPDTPSDEEPEDRPVIAVLPFERVDDADTASPASGDHLTAGLTAEIVAALARHRWLRVLARSTTAAVVAAHDPQEVPGVVRDRLGARYLVEGTMRVGDGRLRVTVSLTDATSGACAFAERFDRQFEDLFDVLDQIVDLIVATIDPAVGHAERARARSGQHADLRAWDLHHLGVDRLFRFTAADNHDAQRLLGRARELDPTFPDAHAWWAYAVVLGMTYWDTDPDTATLDAALEAAQTAVRIDPQDAVAHMIRGRVHLARREYAAALLDNERAIGLTPTFAAAHCGLGDSLSYEGRADEAMRHFERSVELGAYDPQRWAFLSYGSLALIFSGRYEEAVEWARAAQNVPNCQYWASAHEVVARGLSGHDGSDAVGRLARIHPGFTVETARRKLFYLKRSDQVARYLEGLRAAGVPD